MSYFQEEDAYESVRRRQFNDASTSSQDSGIVAESMALPIHGLRRGKGKEIPPAEAIGSSLILVNRTGSPQSIPSFEAKMQKGHQSENRFMF